MAKSIPILIVCIIGFVISMGLLFALFETNNKVIEAINATGNTTPTTVNKWIGGSAITATIIVVLFVLGIMFSLF